jgi:hypothetical protein
LYSTALAKFVSYCCPTDHTGINKQVELEYNEIRPRQILTYWADSKRFDPEKLPTHSGHLLFNETDLGLQNLHFRISLA